MSAKLQWTSIHGIFVVVSTDGDVSDDIWNQLIDDLRRARVATYFAVALGNTNVNQMQRKKVVDVVKGKGMTARVVTDSTLTRGLVTAVSWFVPGIKSFSSENMNKAIESLLLPATKADDVVIAIERLKLACMRNAA